MIRNSLIALALLAGAAAHAQTFGANATCYNWQGGNYSAGSFSKCSTDAFPAAPKPIPVVQPAPVAVAPSPVMMPMSCPPIVEKPQVVKPKPRPKPRPVC